MAGDSGVEKLDVVFVDVGAGKRSGVVLKPEREVADGTLKASVDVAGDVFDLAYRSPKDAEENQGLTFWLKNDK